MCFPQENYLSPRHPVPQKTFFPPQNTPLDIQSSAPKARANLGRRRRSQMACVFKRAFSVERAQGNVGVCIPPNQKSCRANRYNFSIVFSLKNIYEGCKQFLGFESAADRKRIKFCTILRNPEVLTTRVGRVMDQHCVLGGISRGWGGGF